jgi:FkbM family methyltransferase
MKDSSDPDRALAGAKEQMTSGREEIAKALKRLHVLLSQVTTARGRGTLNQQIWNAEQALGLRQGYFSQSGQDAWLERVVFKGKRGGIFAEIGGHDGVTGSNCLWFELMRGWTGLLAEPAPELHARAEQARRCPCLRLAVAATEGTAEFLDVQAGLTQMGGLTGSYDPKTRATVEADPRHRGALIQVPTKPLASLLDEQGLTEIDYVSLDIEGAELTALAVFPFERYRITAWTIENSGGGTELAELMQAKGYRRVEALGVDEVYLRAAD